MDNYSSRRITVQVVRKDESTQVYLPVPNYFMTITMSVKEISGVGYHVKFMSIQPLGVAEYQRNDGINIRLMFACEGAFYATPWSWFADNTPFMNHPYIYVTDQISKNFIFCKA